MKLKNIKHIILSFKEARNFLFLFQHKNAHKNTSREKKTDVHFLEEASFIWIVKGKVYKLYFLEETSLISKSQIPISKFWFNTSVNKRQSSQKLDKECTINNILNIFNKYFVKWKCMKNAILK